MIRTCHKAFWTCFIICNCETRYPEPYNSNSLTRMCSKINVIMQMVLIKEKNDRSIIRKTSFPLTLFKTTIH